MLHTVDSHSQSADYWIILFFPFNILCNQRVTHCWQSFKISWLLLSGSTFAIALCTWKKKKSSVHIYSNITFWHLHSFLLFTFKKADYLLIQTWIITELLHFVLSIHTLHVLVLHFYLNTTVGHVNISFWWLIIIFLLLLPTVTFNPCIWFILSQISQLNVRNFIARNFILLEAITCLIFLHLTLTLTQVDFDFDLV